MSTTITAMLRGSIEIGSGLVDKVIMSILQILAAALSHDPENRDRVRQAPCVVSGPVGRSAPYAASLT
ncbi:hypothetical protein MesoLjLc_77870 [Mesorhizobium sp. L-8-10]|nr:hypothetical protein MesoLjLc_77870 [Mesorhizobium sp. L-8-10]